MSKVSTCLWFGKDAEAAARFYVSLVPNSSLEHIQRSPSAWPGGEAGDVILVTFNLAGQSFQALNGGTPANYGTAASISDAMGWRGRDGTITAGSNRRSAPCHSRTT